jgi:hypothetical protein
VPSPLPVADDERRPGLVLAIYSWDMLLALLALLGALAAFGGQATVGDRVVSVTVGEQILAGISSASYAALLIILATLLTRRHRWVRRAQLGTFAAAIGLGALSLLLEAVLPGQGVALSYVLTAALVLLLDAVAIVMLTGARIVGWYTTEGPIPSYITGTLGFWVVSSLVLVVLQALR